MSNPIRIGFIGLGQMATALASGFLRANLTDSSNLFGYDVSAEAAKKFENATNVRPFDNPESVVQSADALFLAVKPQYMNDALRPVKSALEKNPSPLVVSIAAGLTIGYYEDVLPQSVRIVRVMPNTPCLVGQAAAAFALGKNATRDDAETVKTLLQTVGLAYELPENQLDAVTGLSGSGPAYAFIAIEALADGGVKAGLPRNVALDLAAQTLKGAAEMYLQTKRHPGALKDAVTSPAGTTIAGVAALEERGFRSALIEAVERATLRSRELGSK